MSKKSPEVDAYIAAAAEFGRPILNKIRRLVHRACPRVIETIKWGVPYFEYQGLLLGMAAFKQHVSFGFWQAKQMRDPAGLFARGAKASMCNVRATTVADLPPDDVVLSYLAEAIQLNEDKSAGLANAQTSRQTAAKVSTARRVSAKSARTTLTAGKRPAAAAPGKSRVVVPPLPNDLRRLMQTTPAAQQFFETLSPSAQRDYLVWIESAKREATRANRLQVTLRQLSEGKTLHWKYERR